MITVNELTKKYGDLTAVNDVSFTVQRKEILGFLGPNGAGKTTTMRMITGYVPPSHGSVLIDGMDVFEHSYEVKARIGYMPEQPPLYYDMTARECLVFVAEIHGMRGSKVRTSIEKVSELCGITHMLDRLTGNLSKGYRQRVGLAQALIHDPEVLILDEPTSGLDPGQIIEIRALIKSLGKERTVILSSHILPEVTNVCNRVAIINNGKLVAVDTIEKLSDSLSGGSQFTVKVIRPERVLTEKIVSIEGVTEIIKGDDNSFILTVIGGAPVFEQISSQIVDMGAGLVEMRELSMTLEDIFLLHLINPDSGIFY